MMWTSKNEIAHMKTEHFFHTTRVRHNVNVENEKVFLKISLPFKTCTLTVSGFACAGMHVYLPESETFALCISK